MLNLLITTTLILIIGLVIFIVYKQKKVKNPPSGKTIQKDTQTKATIDRIFIFDFTVVDPITFISRPLKAKITIKNIDLFLNPAPINSVSNQISYKSPVNEELFSQNVYINFVGINQDKFEITPEDETDPHFYEIKNKFSLLDPFLTSGNDMKITDEMKSNFNKIVDKKSKLIDVQYQNYKKEITKN
jgi:hypothetical protein